MVFSSSFVTNYHDVDWHLVVKSSREGLSSVLYTAHVTPRSGVREGRDL